MITEERVREILNTTNGTEIEKLMVIRDLYEAIKCARKHYYTEDFMIWAVKIGIEEVDCKWSRKH